MPAKGTLIADGVYDLHHVDKPTGTESWRVEKFAHGGLVFTSNAELARPKSLKWNLALELSQAWAPRRMTLDLSADGRSVASEQRGEGGLWRGQVMQPNEPAKEVSLPFGNKHEVYFPSPLFNWITLVRLNLQVGKSAEIETIILNLLTLEPRAAKQIYTCTAEEKVEVPAGKFLAWHYTVRTEREGSATSENNFWADRQGVILRYASTSGDEVHLSRYRRIDRREE